jgi:hypothetical protein
MKRILVLPVLVAAIAAAALGQATKAEAHNSQWYWTPKAAVNTLFDDGIDWTDGQDWMNRVTCIGRGTSIRIGSGRGFKHLTCHILSEDGEAYVIAFHVKSKHGYLVRFVRYGGIYA